MVAHGLALQPATWFFIVLEIHGKYWTKQSQVKFELKLLFFTNKYF